MHTSSKSDSRFAKFDQSPGSYHFPINSMFTEICLESWLPEPDFQDLARVLEASMFLLVPLSKQSISESRLPDPGFQDLARSLEAIACS